jgi:hypothetical protein
LIFKKNKKKFKMNTSENNDIVEIDDVCFESYPCQHHCTLKSGEIVMLGAREIVKRRPDLLKSGHFSYYTEANLRKAIQATEDATNALLEK